jgi:hypothetical protein
MIPIRCDPDDTDDTTGRRPRRKSGAGSTPGTAPDLDGMAPGIAVMVLEERTRRAIRRGPQPRCGVPTTSGGRAQNRLHRLPWNGTHRAGPGNQTLAKSRAGAVSTWVQLQARNLTDSTLDISLWQRPHSLLKTMKCFCPIDLLMLGFVPRFVTGMTIFLGLLAGCVLLPLATHGATAAKPNIIFLLTDDMGYGDVGCYGGDFVPTPNIDRLATEGTKFTQFYYKGVGPA